MVEKANAPKVNGKMANFHEFLASLAQQLAAHRYAYRASAQDQVDEPGVPMSAYLCRAE